MPAREQVSMATTEFKAYARRRKGKKEGLGGNTHIFQDQPADCRGLQRGHGTTDDDPASRLLSLELDVAEALADFWRMVHRPQQEHVVLRWSCKRKRTAVLLNKGSKVPPMQLMEELEDALSAVKKNRSGCTVGRDSSMSDRDEIESLRCSKDSSYLFDSRAESPSSPLPSLQLPREPLLTCGSPDVKSAFQRVLPLAPCLVTVKTEIEDMHSEGLAMGHQQVSVYPKEKGKFISSKAAVKMEPRGEHGAECLEELEVKSVAVENYKVAGPVSLNKMKSALNEKEKEARRLRRIQANRESARQTIRKKQVLCEDLTRKASTLALENESMKQKRDSLLRELISLKGQNNHLKQQLEKRSSGDPGQELVEAPSKMSSDCAKLPALQAPSLPYAGVPPPAFIWAMAAAAAAAAAANQAYSLNKQEMWDPSFALQHQNGALVLPSVPLCKQTSVPEATEQNRGCASGDSAPTLTDVPRKEGDSRVRICAKSSALEAQCDDSSNNAAHPALEYAEGDLSRKSSCDFSMQAGGCVLPQPTVLSKSEPNSLPGATAISKSMDGMAGRQMTQGAACGYSYSGCVAGFHTQAQIMKGYAAMVAAEARRRRKELTRNKFARARTMRPAAVS